ncbi:hypothetical protein FOCC_FOCC009613 [Frankliniella occidentalis]|nr:hypothetical protein FOCC_FOCC009613 [Frankliniella occidentalis]
MPPKAKTLQSRVKDFEDEGMEVNHIKPNEMMCKFCNKRVEWTKKDTFVKHINGLDHKTAKENWNSPEKKRARQITIEDAVTGAKHRKEEKHQFIVDTVDAFVFANIPVLKLNNPGVGVGDLPVSKVPRETYIPEIAKIHENKIREELRGKEISIYCHETTDKGGRCVYNIIFQTLDPAPQQKLCLVSSTVLDAANAENCARAVMETLQRYEKNIGDVTAFNADSARYMTKCFQTLQGLHEELLHIQCWPHKLHHVGNTFQTTLPELNLAVKHVKKEKTKNNYLTFLQEKYPDNKAKWKAFPSPIITRWNSWKKAVNYLEEHLDDILLFPENHAPTDDHNFEENDVVAGRTSVSIRWLQELSRQEIDKIKVYAEFVEVEGAGVETVIKQLQSKKAMLYIRN